MSSSIEDKIRGLIYGLAVGDQIGGPIRMGLELSKALLDKNTFDEKSILRHYYSWWRLAGFDTGFVTQSVFLHMKHGNTNREAVQLVHEQTSHKTGGCNPMHRASPLALLKSASAQELADFATVEAKLTHYDPIAGECSKFVVLTCRYLLSGQSLSNALVSAYDSIDDLHLKAQLADVIYFDKSKPKLNQQLSNIGYSPDVLRATIYMLKTQTTFEGTMESAFAFAGAGNYCPVTVGAIAGIAYDYTKIQQKWLKRHHIIIDDLEEISQQFVDLWNQ